MVTTAAAEGKVVKWVFRVFSKVAVFGWCVTENLYTADTVVCVCGVSKNCPAARVGWESVCLVCLRKTCPEFSGSPRCAPHFQSSLSISQSPIPFFLIGHNGT